MYWFDTAILALLALGALLGFWSGLLWQVARLASLGIALAITLVAHEPAVFFLRESALREADERVVQASAYVLVFVGMYLVLYFITRLLHDGIRFSHLEAMDRLLGAVFGAAKMAVVLSIICLLLAGSTNPHARVWMQKSALAPVFAFGLDKALIVIPDQYRDNVRATVASLREFLGQPEPADGNKQPDRKDKAEPQKT